MPANAIYVGRPTKWGNPFEVGRDGTRAECVDLYRAIAQGYLCVSKPLVSIRSQERALKAMREAMSELRGKDLACFCPLTAKCHADLLLEIANG